MLKQLLNLFNTKSKKSELPTTNKIIPMPNVNPPKIELTYCLNNNCLYSSRCMRNYEYLVGNGKVFGLATRLSMFCNCQVNNYYFYKSEEN